MKKTFSFIFLICFILIQGKAQVVINEYSCSNIKRVILNKDTIWEPDFDSIFWDPGMSTDELLPDDFVSMDSIALDSIPYADYVAIEDTTCRTCRDNYGKLEDWIELYNPGDTPLDISGFFISDNEKKMNKYQIPSCSAIPAKGYKIIFASGRDLIENDTIHTNFKLSQTEDKKETLFLYDRNGNLLDKIDIIKTKGCCSYGRVKDGSAKWGVFVYPTAGKTNNAENSFQKYAPKPKFDKDAGFYNSNITVIISGATSKSESIYYTIDGSEPNENSLRYSSPVTIDKTTILKAIIIDSDTTVLPGFIQYRSYFINETHGLPVISVSGYMLDSLALGIKPLRPWSILILKGRELLTVMVSIMPMDKTHG
jgi:hypothetical protein